MADSKLTVLTALTDPQLTDLLYMVDDPSGTPLSKKATVQDVLALSLWAPPQGMRLSAQNNTYIPTTDQTAVGTIYWTPVISGGHGTVTGYNGTVIASKSVTQKSLALTVTSAKNYDVFYDYDGDVLALSAAWTDDTTRADAFADEQGAIVLGSDHTKLWLGTIRASGSNTIEDSRGGTTTQVGAKRFVWNAYNQVWRPMSVIDTTNTWSYTTASYRQANGASGNQVEAVTGIEAPEIKLFVRHIAISRNALNTNAGTAIGVDSSTTAANPGSQGFLGLGLTNATQVDGIYTLYPGIGYHSYRWLELGDSNIDFFGDLGLTYAQAGIFGGLLA